MAKYFAVFLALVAFHDALLITNARQIKPLKQQHSSPNKDTVALALEHNLKSTLPSSQKNVNLASLGDSDEGYTNAFRPTTPGGSPGVGHRIITAQNNNNMKATVTVQSPDVDMSLTEGTKDDFKPTDPGHSPGVGHSHNSKIEHPN
ncbi:hypothetical protein VNO77_25308 [Canavalia gladiata]|uniref:Precursor of CEP9 n=1 Tax=Canavalia gladiata TaxID=3824 RepID=A0AAN9L8F6_CANGL